MELRIVILYSLLLAFGLGSSSADDSTVNDRLESLFISDSGIDPWQGVDGSAKPRRPVKPSALGPENDAESATVNAESEGVAGETVSAVALATGRGKRTERAAEILNTNENQQQSPAVSVSSSVLPNAQLETTTVTTLPTPSSDSLSTPEPVTSDEFNLEMTSTTTPIVTTMATATPTMPTSGTTSELATSVTHPSSTWSQPPSEPLDETLESDHANATSTPSSNQNGNEEYVADDGGGASAAATTDVTLEDEATTIAVDKANASSDDHHHHNSSAVAVNETMTTETSARSSASAVVAVGRALSQEESVPWPEAKSTKVIGTIIEDIHGPFSDGVSSVSTTSQDVLTGSGIAAIVMCTFLVFIATAGASGYWLYRRRFMLNRPETLSERYAPSETGLGAGDDIFRVGYVHSPEMPRDSSEEMYSLDNDSFLTSLEAMTIPTYWTETIKHTKL